MFRRVCRTLQFSALIEIVQRYVSRTLDAISDTKVEREVSELRVVWSEVYKFVWLENVHRRNIIQLL